MLRGGRHRVVSAEGWFGKGRNHPPTTSPLFPPEPSSRSNVSRLTMIKPPSRSLSISPPSKSAHKKPVLGEVVYVSRDRTYVSVSLYLLFSLPREILTHLPSARFCSMVS